MAALPSGDCSPPTPTTPTPTPTTPATPAMLPLSAVLLIGQREMLISRQPVMPVAAATTLMMPPKPVQHPSDRRAPPPRLALSGANPPQAVLTLAPQPASRELLRPLLAQPDTKDPPPSLLAASGALTQLVRLAHRTIAMTQMPVVLWVPVLMPVPRAAAVPGAT